MPPMASDRPSVADFVKADDLLRKAASPTGLRADIAAALAQARRKGVEVAAAYLDERQVVHEEASELRREMGRRHPPACPGKGMIDLHIRGTPRPKPSWRPGANHGKPVAIASAHAKTWRKLILAECGRLLRAGAKPIGGAVVLHGAYYFATPKHERWGKPHTPRPDLDNLNKNLGDALKAGGILAGDDSTIAQNTMPKLWAKEAGAVIHIRPFGVAAPADNDDDLGARPFDGTGAAA